MVGRSGDAEIRRGRHDVDRDGLDAFRDQLRSPTPIGALLETACAQAVDLVSAAEMAGVTVVEEGTSPRTAACTDRRVLDLLTTDRQSPGPDVEAASSGGVVQIGVDEALGRWPDFASRMVTAGVVACLSVPLSFGSTRGSLNVFGAATLEAADVALVRVVVAAVEGSVSNAQRAESIRIELDGLREAMLTRGSIEQAKGILMAIRGVGPDAAFRILSLQSQSENVKLATVARRLVVSIGRSARPTETP